MQTPTISKRSPWPHRVATLLVGFTFPLIWVGGLVTTYDAGMAVPDWPTTYGYNMFLYPWSTWLSGPWDLFIEHGHRLLASFVGLLTIAWVLIVWWTDERRWFRWYSVACLSLVIVQGLLGGLRVRLDANVLARIHGCVGPLFFVAAVTASAFSSSWWHESGVTHAVSPPRNLVSLAWITGALSYMQLILGAHLRHMSIHWAPSTFRMIVFGHLLVAGAMLLHVLVLWARSRSYTRVHGGERFVSRLSARLALLVLLQILIGAGVWRVKYAWPAWLPQPQSLEGYTVAAEGMLQTLTVTLHVAVGSLILASAVYLAVRTSRLVLVAHGRISTVVTSALLMEVVA